MYTFTLDKRNHTVTIMDGATKRGITMTHIGDEMAVFLSELVSRANKVNPASRPGYYEPRGTHVSNPFTVQDE